MVVNDHIIDLNNAITYNFFYSLHAITYKYLQLVSLKEKMSRDIICRKNNLVHLASSLLYLASLVANDKSPATFMSQDWRLRLSVCRYLQVTWKNKVMKQLVASTTKILVAFGRSDLSCDLGHDVILLREFPAKKNFFCSQLTCDHRKWQSG